MNHARFHHPSLPERYRKGCEMIFNGMGLSEAAEEMDLMPSSLTSYLSRARSRGVEVPRHVGGSKPAVPLARLLTLYSRLGDYAAVARAIGSSRENVWQRIKRARKN